jgi:sterol desaturase/sphingolipid hydroxylase (fatty acid hydroxylase superfamily)
MIGIAPSQFVAVVAITQLFENFQHANLRVSFGVWGEHFWVSPRFHRLHHAIGLGHESQPKQGDKPAVMGGHNFGVLLPWWDVMFGTANFDRRFEATGIRDQVEEGRDYGKGFWSQQRLGMKRLMQSLGFSTDS